MTYYWEYRLKEGPPYSRQGAGPPHPAYVTAGASVWMGRWWGEEVNCLRSLSLLFFIMGVLHSIPLCSRGREEENVDRQGTLTRTSFKVTINKKIIYFNIFFFFQAFKYQHVKSILLTSMYVSKQALCKQNFHNYRNNILTTLDRYGLGCYPQFSPSNFFKKYW